MKFPLLLCYLLFSLKALAAKEPEHTDLTKAVPAKTVKITPVALGGIGPDNLRVKLKNLTSKVAFIKVPAGLHFKSPDPNAQDLFTATGVLMALQPNTEKTVTLRGYCMNASNYSPAANAVYAFNGYAAAPLKTLGDSLNKYPQVADHYGQMFVWSITDKRPMYDVSIPAKHLKATQNLVKYVAVTTNQPEVKVTEGDGSSFRPSVEVFSKKITLLFSNPKNDEASFKIYDEQGKVVQTLYENRKLSHGLLNYAVGYNEMIPYGSDPKYYLRVINKQGKVLAEKAFDKHYSDPNYSTQIINYTFEYVLEKPVKNATLRVYLTDGTLVEEFKSYEYLAPGGYRVHLKLNHLYPSKTRFVTKLENADGSLIKQMEIAGH